MTFDPYDIRSWVRSPEGWIFIGLIAFFASISIVEAVILNTLPIERVERQMLSDPRTIGYRAVNIKYLCDANGLRSLVGFHFGVLLDSQSAPVQGLACWNFDTSDWDIEFPQKRG